MVRKVKNKKSIDWFRVQTLKEIKLKNEVLRAMGKGREQLEKIGQMDLSILEAEILDLYKRGDCPSKETIKNLRFKYPEKFKGFTLKHGLYGLPNKELMEFLETEIGDKSKALEIGAGDGWFSKILGIRAVDNYMQRNIAEIKEYYENVGQCTIKYQNSHVEELDGMEGIKRYCPKVVFGSYITDQYVEGDMEGSSNVFCMKDWEMFDFGVEKYILLCSQGTHDYKRVFRRKDLDIKIIDGLTTSRSLRGSYIAVITKSS